MDALNLWVHERVKADISMNNKIWNIISLSVWCHSFIIKYVYILHTLSYAYVQCTVITQYYYYCHYDTHLIKSLFTTFGIMTIVRKCASVCVSIFLVIWRQKFLISLLQWQLRINTQYKIIIIYVLYSQFSFLSESQNWQKSEDP